MGEGGVDQAGQGAFGFQMRAEVGMADAGVEDVVHACGFGEALGLLVVIGEAVKQDVPDAGGKGRRGGGAKACGPVVPTRIGEGGLRAEGKDGGHGGEMGLSLIHI